MDFIAISPGPFSLTKCLAYTSVHSIRLQAASRLNYLFKSYLITSISHVLTDQDDIDLFTASNIIPLYL